MSKSNRGVSIGGNVTGGVIITGDGNQVEQPAEGENQIVGDLDREDREVQIDGDVDGTTIVTGDDNEVKRE